MLRPVFILSLPRSGSTLLQRLIATHPAVATASEPWLLLPLFLGFRNGHVYTSYQQHRLAQAFTDFLQHLPEGPATYRRAVRRFATTMYEKACDQGQSHYLDKTPRYFLIAEDLLQTFPDAYFLLLWRNPLAVAASCIQTWGRGRWNLFYHRIDLYHGLANLVALQRRHGERICSLRYEDLVGDPDGYLRQAFDHLGLEPVADASRRFKEVRLTGNMGDRKGDQVYSDISTSSCATWPTSFATPPRRSWARSYLRWLGPERLHEMGYDSELLVNQLTGAPTVLRGALSDLARMCYGRLFVAGEIGMFRRKRELARQGLQIDVLSE